MSNLITFAMVLFGGYAIFGTIASALSDPTGDEVTYIPFLGGSIWEFETKEQAKHAKNLIEQEYDVKTSLYPSRGILWWKKWPVEIYEGSIFWSGSEGQEIISIVTHEVRTEETQ